MSAAKDLLFAFSLMGRNTLRPISAKSQRLCLSQRLDKHGKLLESERHRYNYVAVIEETMPGALNVDEYCDGSGGASGFPSDIATLGMPSLAMIFHPYHLTELEITCGGSSVWHDRAVWQVHFQQRKDKPARMSIIRVGNQVYPVSLKGSAWIDAESYQSRIWRQTF